MTTTHTAPTICDHGREIAWTFGCDDQSPDAPVAAWRHQDQGEFGRCEAAGTRPSKLHTCTDACGYCRVTARLAVIAARDDASQADTEVKIDLGGDGFATSHTTIVQREGYQGDFHMYRALCSCCGPIGRRYLSQSSAQVIADDHTATPYQRHQVSYRRTERGTMQPVPGTVIWATRDASRAIDLTAEELRADVDTVSFVITGVKAVV